VLFLPAAVDGDEDAINEAVVPAKGDVIVEILGEPPVMIYLAGICLTGTAGTTGTTAVAIDLPLPLPLVPPLPLPLPLSLLLPLPLPVALLALLMPLADCAIVPLFFCSIKNNDEDTKLFFHS
jgi:hypothetical protein